MTQQGKREQGGGFLRTSNNYHLMLFNLDITFKYNATLYSDYISLWWKLYFHFKKKKEEEEIKP